VQLKLFLALSPGAQSLHFSDVIVEWWLFMPIVCCKEWLSFLHM